MKFSSWGLKFGSWGLGFTGLRGLSVLGFRGLGVYWFEGLGVLGGSGFIGVFCVVRFSSWLSGVSDSGV